MDAPHAAVEFASRYRDLYGRFYRRSRPTAYRPSPEALAVLEHLERTGPLTVTEAAHHFARSQAAMSELIARLEARDLVARAADGRDRRRTLVWMTDAGLDALRRSREVLSIRLLEHAMAQLQPEAREALVAGLGGLLETEVADEGWDDA